MTIDKQRVRVLIALLQEALPYGAGYIQLNQIETAYLRPEFTAADYDRVPEESINLWNAGRKIDAIKFMRPLFHDFDLGQCKRVIETHPQAR